jgi:hypothetical protein
MKKATRIDDYITTAIRRMRKKQNKTPHHRPSEPPNFDVRALRPLSRPLLGAKKNNVRALTMVFAKPACEREGCILEVLSRCSGCKLARYCSRECQKIDWKHHKDVCKIYRKISRDNPNMIELKYIHDPVNPNPNSPALKYFLSDLYMGDEPCYKALEDPKKMRLLVAGVMEAGMDYADDNGRRFTMHQYDHEMTPEQRKSLATCILVQWWRSTSSPRKDQIIAKIPPQCHVCCKVPGTGPDPGTGYTRMICQDCLLQELATVSVEQK